MVGEGDGSDAARSRGAGQPSSGQGRGAAALSLDQPRRQLRCSFGNSVTCYSSGRKRIQQLCTNRQVGPAPSPPGPQGPGSVGLGRTCAQSGLGPSANGQALCCSVARPHGQGLSSGHLDIPEAPPLEQGFRTGCAVQLCQPRLVVPVHSPFYSPRPIPSSSV